MFAKMGQGARSMLGSFSTPSASPNREREDDRDDHEKDDEKDEGDAGMVGVDLRVMKTYMRDLTMRLSADAGGSEGRGGGGAKAKAKGGGTIRLYHAMNKGHQRLAIQKKNESDTETKKSENENEEEGRKKSEGAENEDENENESDGWAAKRRQLGEAKKGDPVFVWKTLTPRQHNPSALSSDDSKVVRKKKGELLRKEFIDTEASYVQNLDTIIKVFLNPLKDLAAQGEHRAIISAAHADLIFGRVVPLHLMHRELLEEFKKAESSKASFVDAFFFFVPYLKLHTQYVNKHPSAIDLLLKLTRANARFRRFLDECLGKTGMDAESFLILPIQRLPRYELLLTDMVKQTVHSPPEHHKLQTLLAQIKEINRTVEESRKREENMEKMFRVHKSLVFPSREAQINLFDRVSRSYEREGPLQVCTNIATRRFESRYFFLFDDIMLCTRKRSGESYKFEYMFELRHIVPRAEGNDISAFGGDGVFGLVDQQGRLESELADDADEDDYQVCVEGGDDHLGRARALSSDGIGGAAAEGPPQALYLKAASLHDKVEWIEILQQLCSRSWTRVNFVRSRRAESVPILPATRASPTRSKTEERLPSSTTIEETVAVPPRPSVYRRVEQKVARLRRKSGEVALHMLSRGDKSAELADMY